MTGIPAARGHMASLAAVLKRHWLPALALLALAAVPFVPALVHGRLPWFLDIEDHWNPIRLAACEARGAGAWPHWFRYAFCGVPLCAQLESANAYPPHLVLDLFPPAVTLLPVLVGHRLLLGLLLYTALVRRGVSRTAAFLGAAAAMHAGPVTTAVSQPAVLRTLAWAPCLVIAAHDLCRGRRLSGLLWLASGAGMMLVAGYPPFLERTVWLVAILLLLDPGFPATLAAWRERGLGAVAVAAGVVLAVGLAAVQLVPSAALASVSQRQLGLEPNFADTMRAAPADLLLLVAPRFTGDGGVVRLGFAYLGAVPLALALLAVIRGAAGARALAAAAAFSLLAALGRNTPLGVLLQSLPAASGFRNPSQYLLIWCIAVPVLAGLGLDAWRHRRPSGREIALAAGVPGAVLLLAAFLPSVPEDTATWFRFGIVAAAIASVAVAWRLPNERIALGLLVLVAVCDAGSLGLRYVARPSRTRPFAEAAAPDASFARIAAHHAASGATQPARVITSDAVLNWDNHPACAGLENVRGLFTLVPMRTLDLSRVIAEGAPFERRPAPVPLYDYGPTHALASPLVDLLALRYAAGFASPGPGWRRIGAEEWERDAVDEARIIARTVAVAGDDAAWRELVRPGFDPRTTAVVESAAPLPAGDGTVAALRAVANGADMDVEAKGDAVLLWSESHDAGWTASIDGAPVAIVRANHAHMAVTVPSGRHSVSWRYESPGFRLGAAISLLSLGAFGALVFLCRKRRGQASGGTPDRPRT